MLDEGALEEYAVTGDSYYASPTGSGNCSSQAKACEVATALQKAQSGDEVVLLDGAYKNTQIFTRRAGVTFRALNRHKATISYSGKVLFHIRHKNTTVRGLAFDGLKTSRSAIESGRNTQGSLSNILIEDNHIENFGGECLHLTAFTPTSDVIIRHNTIKNCGWNSNGETLYIGSSSQNQDDAGASGVWVSDVEIYGNHLIGFTQNGIDYKPNVRRVVAHHNILEKQVYRTNPKKDGNEGSIVVQGENNVFRDNIVRHIDPAGPAIFYVAGTGGHDVRDNVAYDAKGMDTGVIASRGRGSGGAASKVRDNTLCDLATYNVVANDGLQVSGNAGAPGSGAPMSACRSEEARILREMKNLPGRSGASGSCLVASDDFEWVNQSISAGTGSFTVEFDATPSKANTNAVIGLSSGAASGFGDLATAVRFNTGGEIDVRDGDAYGSDTRVTYSAGATYQIRMDVDLSSGTYDVYATPVGGSERVLATGYAFRPEQADVGQLNNLASALGSSGGVGSVATCNVAM